ncbi:hypothetical protein A3F62_00280 [Candidatus Woesebacteria bacterium RIFCSPHIGHO2_12_FULL_44_11]|uniref:Glycosyltransferase 2-like domain-containing protein n=1 Tax=Candidatus Woesebacteria bacterium RIFCSPLOWO2_01_FULL_44_14 TaxID=1802525 RepID=A0A1F8C294_9BACT|nr:MAG: hypothetical protein A3F62_00280 [Candidatus Woesebacteria bacterium RIFCSPHIGHO2_12_FULL_44_11]OGM69959.1 MAG: hypothetical protein A2975_05120 [Candidatus Woesebacteria bacterium RIFCSPLOWO2_01_FULL_44_14]
MPKIFIVILNWNQPKLTLETVESVSRLRVTGYGLRIVVVDNGSDDNSLAELRKLTRNAQHATPKQIELLINEKNLGYAGGNNVGIRYALKNGADWVLVVNNDVSVDKDLIIELLKVADKYPKVGVIGPKIYFAKGFEFYKKRYKKEDLGKILWYAGGEINWDHAWGSPRGADEVDRGQYDKVEETDYATGTAVLLNAKALKKVGFFYDKYFMYYEDTDLSVRMKRAGWKILFAPGAVVYHKVAQSSTIGGDLNDYFITRNRMYFGMLYAPFRTRLNLMKQAVFLLMGGRPPQKKAIFDYFVGRMGRGSWR